LELSDIKGLGTARIKKLNAAGIFSPRDLLSRFPYSYADFTRPFDAKGLKDGDTASFIGVVSAPPLKKFLRKGLTLVRVTFDVQNAAAPPQKAVCSWFNRRYIAANMRVGARYYVTGKVKKFGGAAELSAPTAVLDDGSPPSVMPLYRPLKGLPPSVFTEALRRALEAVRIEGYFDKFIGGGGLGAAVRAAHLPRSLDEAAVASEIVTLDNLAFSICSFDILKNSRRKNRAFSYKHEPRKLQEFIASLPFTLTESQSAAIDGLVGVLRSPETMNSLLQGDVASGKTVVAAALMYYASLSGKQSVFMAPTEILARQHYKTLISLLEPFNVRAELLTGSLAEQPRKNVLFNVKTGAADVIVGTHALIADGVEFNDLSLVITDEQQRFGVAQRGALENKAVGADRLVMTATPIPRTLALTLYGDLKETRLQKRPQGARVTTKFVPAQKERDMLGYLKKCAAAGLQTFIVCPRVDADDETDLVSAEEYYAKIKPEFDEYGAALLHGRMSERQKAAVMDAFADGAVKVLVATTVVEVGIDVPDAVNMVIFNAERYGLSQLHQLRGRVGRGQNDGFCFLLSDNLTDAAKERLDYFAAVSDGFALSEYDFSRRGAGDFLGERQSGKTAFPVTPDLLKKARALASAALADPPSSARIAKSLSDLDAEYLGKLTLN
jgi:ATP-dependent DNA helicase RecG